MCACRCLQKDGTEAAAPPRAAAASPPRKRGSRGGTGEGDRRGGDSGAADRGPAAPANALAVPPKLAMSLLKEKELRERLRAYNLPTTGKRAVRLILSCKRRYRACRCRTRVNT